MHVSSTMVQLRSNSTHIGGNLAKTSRFRPKRARIRPSSRRFRPKPQYHVLSPIAAHARQATTSEVGGVSGPDQKIVFRVRVCAACAKLRASSGGQGLRRTCPLPPVLFCLSRCPVLIHRCAVPPLASRVVLAVTRPWACGPGGVQVCPGCGAAAGPAGVAACVPACRAGYMRRVPEARPWAHLGGPASAAGRIPPPCGGRGGRAPPGTAAAPAVPALPSRGQLAAKLCPPALLDAPSWAPCLGN